MCKSPCTLQLVIIPLLMCCAPGAASSLSAISSTNTTIAFGTVEAVGNAVLRLEVDEVELISGNWTKSGFTIPVCGANSVPINSILWAMHLRWIRQKSICMSSACSFSSCAPLEGLLGSPESLCWPCRRGHRLPDVSQCHQRPAHHPQHLQPALPRQLRAHPRR